MLLQFSKISLTELIPLCWIVIKPSPQLRTRCDVLKPSFERQVFLLDTSRPEALNQETDSVFFSSGFVCSLNPNHLTYPFAVWMA